MTTYNLRIDYDPEVESPNEHSLLRVVSFSTRHDSFEHPDNYLFSECPECKGLGSAPRVTATHRYASLACERCEGEGQVECALIDHPDVVAVLSYYEHGDCVWMVGPSSVSDYGGFDTVNVAGVLVLNDVEDSERAWWEGQTEDSRVEAMRLTVECYTHWSNGECYWYDLTTVDGEPVDSCGGYIGFDHLLSALADVRKSFDIQPGDVSMVGELAKSI